MQIMSTAFPSVLLIISLKIPLVGLHGICQYGTVCWLSFLYQPLFLQMDCELTAHYGLQIHIG